MNRFFGKSLLLLAALSSWALVAAAAQSKGAFPNPVRIAPRVAGVWHESLESSKELQWTEKAVVHLDDLDRLTELSSNHLTAAGEVSREVQESKVHGYHRTGMKRRIRDNIALLSRSTLQDVSRFVASYAFPSKESMQDQVARCAIVISDVPGLQGDWELTTRNAMRDDDLLTMWVQPETGRILKMNYQSWIKDEPVKAETLFQILPDGSDVPRRTTLSYVQSGMIVRIDYSNYAKRSEPN